MLDARIIAELLRREKAALREERPALPVPPPPEPKPREEKKPDSGGTVIIIQL